MLLGKEYAIYFLPLLVSCVYYIMWYLIGYVLRRIINAYCQERLAPYAMNFAMSLVFMAMCFEGGQMRRNYGYYCAFASSFCLGIFGTYLSKNAPLKWSTNPIVFVGQYAEGKVSFMSALFHVSCQLAGCIMGFHSARQFWSMGLTEGHAHKYSAQCGTDLKVSASMGFFIEFSMTLLSLLLGQLSCENEIGQWILVAGKQAFSSGRVFMFVAVTGMYGHPIAASVATFGCKGTGIIDHMLVYWASTILAAMACVFLKQCWSNRNMSNNTGAAQDNVIGTRESLRQKLRRSFDNMVELMRLTLQGEPWTEAEENNETIAQEVRDPNYNRFMKQEEDEEKSFDCIDTNFGTEMRRR